MGNEERKQKFLRLMGAGKIDSALLQWDIPGASEKVEKLNLLIYWTFKTEFSSYLSMSFKFSTWSLLYTLSPYFALLYFNDTTFSTVICYWLHLSISLTHPCHCQNVSCIKAELWIYSFGSTISQKPGLVFIT